MLALLAALLTMFYIGLVQLNGVDFWLQAKIGEIVWDTGNIPRTLLFPFTEMAGEHFNAHEWLASVLFHLLLQGLGEQGMAVLTGVLSGALGLLFVRLARVHAQTPRSLALLCGLLAVGVENYRHVMHPELISLLLMAIYWICLERYVNDRTRTWLPLAGAGVATVLWANVHASFVLVLFVASIYTAGAALDALRTQRKWSALGAEPVRRMALFTAVMMLCTLVNPFGLELLRFALGFGSTNEFVNVIGEWMPTLDPRVRVVRGLWIGLAAWLVLLASAWSTRDLMRSADWLLLLFFTLLAVKAIRFPLYLCFLLPLYLPRALQRWAGRWLQGDSWHVVVGTCAAAMSLATYLYGNAAGANTLLDATRTKFTEAMVREINDPAYHGNVLNSMELGAELIYRSYPRLRPASDCRVDSYGLDYLAFLNELITNEKLFNEFVERYDVQYLLLNTPVFFMKFQKSPMWESGQWRIILVDQKVAFIGRKH